MESKQKQQKTEPVHELVTVFKSNNYPWFWDNRSNPFKDGNHQW